MKREQRSPVKTDTKGTFYSVPPKTALRKNTFVTERFKTLRNWDLEVRGSSIVRRVLFLDKELYSPLSLFIRCINGYQRHSIPPRAE